jgi:hypothetical protein
MNFLNIIEIAILALVAWLQWRAYSGTKMSLYSQYSTFPIQDKPNYRVVTGVFTHSQAQQIESGAIQKQLEAYPEHSHIHFFQTNGQELPSDFREVKLIGGKHPSNVFADIQRDINIYLCRNQNKSTDFKTIQDIIERHCQITNAYGDNTLSLPLYYGLLGTIMGIILGAFYIGTMSADDSQSVVALLRTVGIAMSVSGFGLLLTIWNINLQKDTAYVQESSKNKFLIFLQTELIPQMPTTLDQGLKTMQEGLVMFNTKFQKNLESFDRSTSSIGENLTLQKEFLERLDKIEFNKMVRETVGIFEQLGKSADALRDFKQYQEGLNVGLKNLDKTVRGFETLYDRTSNFEQNLTKIAENIAKQDQTYHKLLAMLEANSSEVGERKESLREIMDEIHAFFRTQYEQLAISAEEQNTKLINLNTEHIGEIRNAYGELEKVIKEKIDALKLTAEQEVLSLEETYRDKKQVFNSLERLPKIEQALQEANNVTRKNEAQIALLATLEQLNDNLDKIANAQPSGISVNWKSIQKWFGRDQNNDGHEKEN